LTIKPGVERQRTGCFPQSLTRWQSCSTTSAEVARPLTTSTSFITGAGLKKCSPATRSGCFIPAAMAVIDIDDVLLTSSVDGEQISASCLNSAFSRPGARRPLQ
jgi:hypothetical protein